MGVRSSVRNELKKVWGEKDRFTQGAWTKALDDVLQRVPGKAEEMNSTFICGVPTIAAHACSSVR